MHSEVLIKQCDYLCSLLPGNVLPSKRQAILYYPDYERLREFSNVSLDLKKRFEEDKRIEIASQIKLQQLPVIKAKRWIDKVAEAIADLNEVGFIIFIILAPLTLFWYLSLLAHIKKVEKQVEAINKIYHNMSAILSNSILVP